MQTQAINWVSGRYDDVVVYCNTSLSAKRITIPPSAGAPIGKKTSGIMGLAPSNAKVNRPKRVFAQSAMHTDRCPTRV